MAWPVPKGAQTVTDANGVVHYLTQGGNWRNTQTGDVSKTQPAAGGTTPPPPGPPSGAAAVPTYPNGPPTSTTISPGTGVYVNQPGGYPIAPAIDVSNSASALQTQEAFNRYNMYQQGQMNRVGEINPYGKSEYVTNPDGTVSRVSTLSPEQQNLLNAQQQRDRWLNYLWEGKGSELGYQGPASYAGLTPAPQVPNYANLGTSMPQAPQFGSGMQRTMEYRSPEQRAAEQQMMAQRAQYMQMSPEQRAAYKQSAMGQQGQPPQIAGPQGPQVDESGLPIIPGGGNLTNERQRIEDELYARFERTQEPKFDLQKKQLQQQLADQGIPMGSELYKRQMADLDESQNAARLNARSQAVGQGLGEQQGVFGMGLQGRQQLVGERAQQFQLGSQARQQATQEAQDMYGMGLQGRNLATQEYWQLRNAPWQEAQTLLGMYQGVQNPEFSPLTKIDVPNLDVAGVGLGYGQLAQQWDIAKMNDETRRYLGELGAASGGEGGTEYDPLQMMGAEAATNLWYQNALSNLRNQTSGRTPSWWEGLAGAAAGGFAGGFGNWAGQSLFG